MSEQEQAVKRALEVKSPRLATRRRDQSDHLKVERKLQADVAAWLKERRTARQDPGQGRAR